MTTRGKSGVRLPVDHLNLQAAALSPVPRTYRAALADPNWRIAMEDEFTVLLTNRTAMEDEFTALLTTSPSEREFHRWLVTGDILQFSDNLYATFLNLSNGVAALTAKRSRSGRMLAIDVGATGLAGRVLAQCAADIAPADCVQCLEDAARAMLRCFWDAREQGENVAVVLSYDCVLRFDTSSICGTLKLFAFAAGAALGIIMSVKFNLQ